MDSTLITPTIDDIMFDSSGELKHFKINPICTDEPPTISVTIASNETSFIISHSSISLIVTQNLASVIDEYKPKYTNKDFNRVKNKVIKILNQTLLEQEIPQAKATRTDAYNSLLGLFYKNNKWCYFNVYRDKHDPSNIKMTYAKRDVGLTVLSLTKTRKNRSFDKVFDHIFNYACKKEGLSLDWLSIYPIRLLLKQYLFRKYTRLLNS